MIGKTLGVLLATAVLLPPVRPTVRPTVIVSIHPKQVINSFIPTYAFGAGVDGRESGAVDRTYTPHNLSEMKAAGLQSLTYRLRTELGCEAWHWNPQGKWSDPKHRQGYFVGNFKPTGPILKSYGYRLPRRGNTIDQANNNGYSRLDDGNASTYWKSNPYLDPAFTHDAEDLNPQWVVVDLGKLYAVDAIRIQWANPFAVRYRIEYWDGQNAIQINENPGGQWITFDKGEVWGAKGGDELRTLGAVKKVRFVRLWLLRSSHTWEGGPRKPADRRDAMGFAIREISLGRLSKGRLIDIVRHRPKTDQTPFFVSSTDPWHRAVDIDKGVEQPGFDLVLRSGLHHGMPILTPAPVLYDNPDNAAAEMRWLKLRGWPVKEVEMGEEPDGQYVSAEHYAALYLQVAKRLKNIDPHLKLGGPCFQTTITDVSAWPDNHRSRSWMRRFLDYLDGKQQRSQYQFFSFEWYPFDDTNRSTVPQLLAAPKLLSGVLARLQDGGLTHDIPWMITEYGYSAFAGPPEVDLPGAILNLDTVGKFLECGGARVFLYGYEPNELITERLGVYGNLMMLLMDEYGKAQYRLPTFYAAQMMTRDWCLPTAKTHHMVKCESSNEVAAYTVRRPDGKWSLLLLNKNPHAAISVQVKGLSLSSKVSLTQYGKAQYVWHEAKDEGYPLKSLPPVHKMVASDHIVLPPYSCSVVTW